MFGIVSQLWTIKSYSQQVAQERRYYQQNNKEARGLEVEEETYQKEIAVAPQASCLGDSQGALSLVAHSYDDAEKCINQQKERPKVKLGKEEGMVAVKSKKSFKHLDDEVEGLVSMDRCDFLIVLFHLSL